MTNNKQQMLTPQENAIYLIHLFNRGGYGKINARIHVEEILSINSVDKDEDLSNYWEEVKQEIETYGGGEQ